MVITDTIMQGLRDANQAARLEKFDEALQELNTIKFPTLVNFLTNVTGFDETFWASETNREALELAVTVTQEIYNNAAVHESPISDELFDHLYAVYEQVLARPIVGATVGNRADKVISAHRYPDLRGTLDKIHFIENKEKRPEEARKSLEDWLNSIARTLGAILTGEERKVLLTPKWDGVSAVCECSADGVAQRVLKRGDTTRNEAEEMTELFCPDTTFDSFEFYKNRTFDGEFAVKVEIVMTNAQFTAFRKLFPDVKTPRSAVSSIINSHDTDKKWLEYLTIIPIRVQVYNSGEQFIPEDVGILYPTYTIANVYGTEAMQHAISDIQKRVQADFGIAIDGVVISLLHPNLLRLGRKDNINKYEVAYKLPGEQAETILEDILFSVGDTGAVTPVAVFQPVQMKGVTVRNASLGSMNRMQKLQLSKGDRVRILYDVIPYLECDHPSKENVIQAPTHCPTCGEPLQYDIGVYCANDECMSRRVGRLVRFITKMDIADIGEETVRRFVTEGILSDIPDLYRLEQKASQILDLPGFGEKSLNRMITNIAKRSGGVEPDVFFGSLGITSIGRRMWAKILKAYAYQDVLTWIREDPSLARKKLIALQGFQQATADRVVNGILKNDAVIRELIDSRYILLSTKVVEEKPVDENTEYVVFTKVRDKLFEQYLDTQNVVVQSDMRKNTTLLVVPNLNETSSKVKKAEKNNIPVKTLEDAYAYFNYQP